MHTIPKGVPMKNQGVVFPVVREEPVQWGHKDLQTTGDYKAIVNPDTGKLFSIVSRHYELIRHEHAIEEVEKAIARTPALGKRKVTTHFYNDGGRMCRRYVFSTIRIDIAPGDVVNPELNLYNSYDVTWPFHVLLGGFRVVCRNGLVVGKRFFQLRRRHIYDLPKMNLKEELSLALEQFIHQTAEWKKWADQPLTQKQHNDIMKAMELGKKATQEIKHRINQESERPNGGNGFPPMTVWVFFNVLCWYITYRAVSLNHREDMERRLRTAASTYL